MRHSFLFLLAVVGVVGAAHAQQMTQEQAQKDLARSLGVPESWAKTGFSCGPGGCRQLDPKENINNSPEIQRARRIATARLQAEGEIHLRKMGMASDVARKAIWATEHRPNSACAYYVRQLTADYDSGADRGGYDEDLVISIEHSGTCERKNLD